MVFSVKLETQLIKYLKQFEHLRISPGYNRNFVNVLTGLPLPYQAALMSRTGTF